MTRSGLMDSIENQQPSSRDQCSYPYELDKQIEFDRVNYCRLCSFFWDLRPSDIKLSDNYDFYYYTRQFKCYFVGFHIFMSV